MNSQTHNLHSFVLVGHVDAACDVERTKYQNHPLGECLPQYRATQNVASTRAIRWGNVYRSIVRRRTYQVPEPSAGGMFIVAVSDGQLMTFIERTSATLHCLEHNYAAHSHKIYVTRTSVKSVTYCHRYPFWYMCNCVVFTRRVIVRKIIR